MGPVVLSEIHFAPGQDGFEFIEIHNPTAEPVDLTDWRLGEGVNYVFTSGTTLASGGSFVVVGFDPANTQTLEAFHTYIGSPVIPVGPFFGDLDDAGETLVLSRANPRPPDSPYTILYTIEDQVSYAVGGPWPNTATGESLHRVAADLFAELHARQVRDRKAGPSVRSDAVRRFFT